VLSLSCLFLHLYLLFFFHAPAHTLLFTLSLHDALPISGSIMDEGIVLLANGARTTRPLGSSDDENGLKMVRTRPLRTDWLKSPRRSSSVGTVRTIEIGRLSFQRSNEVKVKIRFCRIGPPN